MSKKKVRPHPGALAELLKRREMTQMDAASVSGIDRKTLAKINRGEDVKLETLQKLAKKLNAPATHFDARADNSESQVGSKPEEPRWLNLMLRKVDAENLAKMLPTTQRINWQLNFHTIADEAFQFLEQLEEAVNGFHEHLIHPLIDPDVDPDEAAGSLRLQLDGLKKSKRITSLLEELAKHRLAVLGAEYLSWEANKKTTWHDETQYIEINYVSFRNVVLSVEGHPAQPRRANVWQGTEPPKVTPNRYTIIKVNGMYQEEPDQEDVPF